MAQSASFPFTAFTDLIITPKKITEDRIKLPCLDKKGMDSKRINNYQQRLDRFK